MYIECKLPEYPCKTDMWDKIAADPRPIAVYGMGNGADKLFERLERYGVAPSAVFASDGFVRGHKFRGYQVRSLSEVVEEYGDFLILLSFASSRNDVIEMISGINERYSMLVPDMPVAGESYFDKDFYNSNYESILAAYNSFADEDSKNAFASLVNYKLSGELKYLLSAASSVEDIYKLLPEEISVSVDAGAYNGDTVRELMSYRKDIRKIYAFEPDARNFKKLSKFCEESGLSGKIFVRLAAVWNKDECGTFIGSGNRNSSVSSTSSYKNREQSVELVRIDSEVYERVDYIKYDVEGAELEALMGSEKLIEKYRPAMLISAYHRSSDIFSLANYVKEKYPDYSLYMRRTMCFPAWEIALIAIAK